MQHIDINSQIKHIDFDFKCLDKNNIIANEITSKFLEAGFRPEDGFSKLTNLNKNQMVYLFFLNWISVNNEVIDNLNIILSDIRGLPYNHLLMQGEPLTRYKLLLRMFFYEFYRFREKYNQVIKDSAMRGFIKLTDVSEMRKVFHDTFKDTIELRNRLVHSEINWTGEPIYKLEIVSMAKKIDHMLKSIETGEILNSTNILNSTCADDANILLKEGNRVSFFLSYIIKSYVENIIHEN